MKFNYLFLLIFSLLAFSSVKAEENDSTKVAKVCTELISVCKNIDLKDPKSNTLGYFYKAAPYIVYRGPDMQRKWKAIADYSILDEKDAVDGLCQRIHEGVAMDNNYKIEKFFTAKESEGIWYVIEISYINKEGEETITDYAFLKIGDHFALGDID